VIFTLEKRTFGASWWRPYATFDDAEQAEKFRALYRAASFQHGGDFASWRVITSVPDPAQTAWLAADQRLMADDAIIVVRP